MFTITSTGLLSLNVFLLNYYETHQIVVMIYFSKKLSPMFQPLYCDTLGPVAVVKLHIVNTMPSQTGKIWPIPTCCSSECQRRRQRERERAGRRSQNCLPVSLLQRLAERRSSITQLPLLSVGRCGASVLPLRLVSKVPSNRNEYNKPSTVCVCLHFVRLSPLD